mmetsp:Transcript_45316/g.72431  ORF Transcript_45316/g.72431 Transcript_45316/m.72431 type:complete len:585 (+) Transcript_45316:70-1824(+)
MADTDEVARELKTLQEWKKNIGDKAVVSSDEYKKELEILKSQSEQFKNELIDTQRENKQCQEQLQYALLEKEEIAEQLKQLQEDTKLEHDSKDEHEKLSQERLLMKDYEIEQLRADNERLKIEAQSLETQLTTMNEQCNEQQMEINEFNQEILKLRQEKNDLSLQLKEYTQNENAFNVEKQMLSQQLNTQQQDYNSTKEENKRLHRQLTQTQSSLKASQEANEKLMGDNEQYQKLLTKSRENENNLKYKLDEIQLRLQLADQKYNELETQYQEESKQRMEYEHLAQQYEEELEEMQNVSKAEPTSTLRTQTTKKLLLPQRTMMRLASTRKATLRVPSISSSFRTSSRKLTSSMLTSVINVHSSPQAFFYDPGESEFADGSFNDTDSIGTDSSYQGDHGFEVDKDGVVKKAKASRDSGEHKEKSDDIVIPLAPEKTDTKSRKSSRELDTENLTIDLVAHHNTGKAAHHNASSGSLQTPASEHTSGRGRTPSPNAHKMDWKLVEKKIQEEINKELETLEADLHRQYSVEFEQKKQELIDAHEESIAFVTAAHQKLSDQLQVLRRESGEMKELLPYWRVIISHVLAI